MPGDAAQTTRVYLVRHAQAHRFTHAADAGLTDLGRRQAHAAASRLHAVAQRTMAAVYTSPTRRAADTAAILARSFALDAGEDVRLRERAEFPQDADMPVADFVAMWERANQDRHWQPPLGDSAAACGVRMAAFLAACHAQWPGAAVIAVSHGGAIADLLRHQFSPAALAAVNPALAARPYDGAILRECSLTVLDVDGAGIADDAGIDLVTAARGDHLP